VLWGFNELTQVKGFRRGLAMHKWQVSKRSYYPEPELVNSPNQIEVGITNACTLPRTQHRGES
jgi:hypothetical protein